MQNNDCGIPSIFAITEEGFPIDNRCLPNLTYENLYQGTQQQKGKTTGFNDDHVGIVMSQN